MYTKTKKPITDLSKYSRSSEFLYMLLARLQMDCLYFLGRGERNVKHLWALNIADHINEMKCIYNYLSEKPDWLTSEELGYYEDNMLLTINK